ncbi:MAG: undecaprenyl-diphosphate phosphatase [Holosporaceae bacterium]|nr:undecaprenyl-diphosphate phosphatase [Holosporaceae bacterium]
MGAIQGVTEFLPVSSTAHVVLFSQLFDIPYQGKTFDIFLNVGTLLTIVVFFRQQVWDILRGCLDFVCGRKTTNRDFFSMIVLSSLPTFVVGGIAEVMGGVHINSPAVLGSVMIVFSVILYLCDRKPIHSREISRRDSLLVGLVQPISLIPGVSRLGICLSMMRYLKYSREESFRYAMLLSMPPVAGACSLKLLQILLGKAAVEDWSAVAVGGASAFIFGLLFIGVVIKFLRHNTFFPIIIYRVLFGAFTLLRSCYLAF